MPNPVLNLSPARFPRHAGLNLRFLGTRGGIRKRSRLHRRHSVLLIEDRQSRLLIDCGADWRHRIVAVRPTAMILTHAHPDHVGGLIDGAPFPIYATPQTWRLIRNYPIPDRRVIRVGRKFSIGAFDIEAFPVEHSQIAPAVAFRITRGEFRLFYAPDVVVIRHERAALRGISLYIGDGARIERPLVRHRDRARIGHTSIREQLIWCRRNRVKRAVFTHCGSEIVSRDPKEVARRVRALGREFNVSARIAHDGFTIARARHSRGRPNR